MSRSFIVLPDDSAKPTLDAVANAEKSIRIKMFIFSDPSLLQAVIDDGTAFVQSLNWETKNLTVTRDYAVVTSHKHEVEEVALCKTLQEDWANSHPLDLSDEGLLAQLKKDDPDVGEDLAIAAGKH